MPVTTNFMMIGSLSLDKVVHPQKAYFMQLVPHGPKEFSSPFQYLSFLITSLKSAWEDNVYIR